MAAPAGGLAVAERPPARAIEASFAVVPGEAVGGIASEWATLAGRSSGDNVFFSPEFVMPAIEWLGGGSVSVATVAGPNGRLIAVAPFTRTRLGHIAPAVRLWSHKYAPLGLPLVAAGMVDAGVAGLADGLAPEGSGLSLIVPDLPQDGAVAHALGAIAARQGRQLTLLDDHRRAMLLRPPEGIADLRATMPARRRKELGRQMRRMTDAGGVSAETCTRPDEVRAAFETFLALEQAGWKGKSGTALASSPATADFARAVVANLAAAGRARIDTVRVDGRQAAMVVTFVAGATAWTWKIAHDESFARFSPGVQLMLEAPAHIFSDPRVMRIDSCAVADHPMIDRLWPDRLPVATFVLGPAGGGVLHQLGLAAAKAEIVARANMRHLRGRHG